MKFCASCFENAGKVSLFDKLESGWEAFKEISIDKFLFGMERYGKKKKDWTVPWIKSGEGMEKDR
jgi:predicted RNA-binding protein with PUA domain